MAFTTPTKTNYSLAGSTLGQGGLYYGWVARTVSGKTTYTVAAQRGFVVIDTPQMLSQLKGGTGTGLRRTNLLSHELGHAMGLQHVDDTRQQMYPSLRTASPQLFYTGDRYGLTKVGKAAGCINTAYMPLKDLSPPQPLTKPARQPWRAGFVVSGPDGEGRSAGRAGTRDGTIR